jgi:hypothetical protein
VVDLESATEVAQSGDMSRQTERGTQRGVWTGPHGVGDAGGEEAARAA